MNILIDIRPLMDERYSGVAEYTSLLVNALLKIDIENRYFLFYNSAKDVSGRLPNFAYPNVRIIHSEIPNRIFNYPLLKLLGRPRFDMLAEKICGERMDLFFMPHTNFAAWSPRVKSVLAIHDLSFFFFPEFFNWRKNLWHWMLNIRKLIQRFDVTVGFSENTVADIKSLSTVNDNRVRVIASGLKESFIKFSADDLRLIEVREKYQLPERFIFTLSTVEPRKNIEGLIEAFELIKNKQGHERLKLVIAGGRGWKAGPIFKRASFSVFAADIIFLDYVAAEDRAPLYNLATVFAFPSFYEGFGFPPLEAMACGTPTVVSTASCLPEIVAQAALMVDPYNSSALAAAIGSILHDEKLAANLSRKGILQAQKFTWEKTATEYLRLFKQLLSKK